MNSHLEFKIKTMIIGVITILTVVLCVLTIIFARNSFEKYERKKIDTNVKSLIGSFKGVVDGKYSIDQWYYIANQIITDKIALADSNGIYTSGDTLDSDIIASLSHNSPLYHITTSNDKTKYKIVYIPIFDRNLLINIINVEYKEFHTYINSQRKKLIFQVIAFSLFTLIITIFLTQFIYNRIAKSLRIVSSQQNNIQNEQKIMLGHSTGNDDINDLIVHYNKMLDQLQNNYQQLVKSEHESAWREVAKQIAHEIKNPLTPMLLKIQLLQKMKHEGRAEWQTAVDPTLLALIEQINIIKMTVSQFSDFAEINEGECEDILAIDVLKKLELIYGQYQNIETAFTSSDCLDNISFRANNVDFMRIMINLCNNAIQSMESSSVKQLSVDVSHKNSFVIFTVTDTGTGINEEQAANIFNPKFTTKHEGSGLGLAISKKLVEQYNGTITFESQVGIGSSFTVIMPQLPNN